MATHPCSAVVFRCIDHRLNTAIREYMMSLGKDENDYDLASLAGSTKGLAQADRNATTIREQLQIALDKHDVSEAYIIHHTDCGAYGGREAFTSAAAEYAQHSGDMQRSVAALRRDFPSVTFFKVLARIHEDGTVDFELIP